MISADEGFQARVRVLALEYFIQPVDLKSVSLYLGLLY